MIIIISTHTKASIENIKQGQQGVNGPIYKNIIRKNFLKAFELFIPYKSCHIIYNLKKHPVLYCWDYLNYFISRLCNKYLILDMNITYVPTIQIWIFNLLHIVIYSDECSLFIYDMFLFRNIFLCSSLLINFVNNIYWFLFI